MYTSFFGLGEKPFAITPDPRYLYMSERHAEALAHLMYGINEAGGFIQLTGEVGTGKTTVVRTLLEQMPAHADVALILNPGLSPVEFLLTICEELGLFVRDEDTGSVKDLVDVLNRRLLDIHSKNRRAVVIVDEAQNLSTETLEQVRLLTNLETPTHKLLQIILIGQPELREVLARSELRQLAQRITGRYHLNPLSRDETTAYVKHRLKVAGATSEIFTPSALREIHRLTQGIPRIINVICDRALLGGYTSDQHRIGPRLIRRAASEVYGRPFGPTWLNWAIAGTVAAVIVAGIIGFWQLRERPAAIARTAPAATAPAPSAPAPAALPAAASVADTAAPVKTAPAAAKVLDTAALEQFLSAHSAQTTTEQAFTKLLGLWGGTLSAAQGRPCDQARKQGLECIYEKGSWPQLRTFNRPAILTLADKGAEHQVVVASLTDDTARLDFGGQQQEVAIAALSRYWVGDYLLLWRPKVAGLKSLTPGMRSDEVRWLRRGLNTVQGRAGDDPVSDYYDADLAQMVENFQRAHRLDVDGIAGLQTQIALDALTNAAGAPQLVPHVAAGS